MAVSYIDRGRDRFLDSSYPVSFGTQSGLGRAGINTPAVWTAPADWIDITNPADNEINLLVADISVPTMAFACTIAASGTYSIDWGDGTIETARASTTTYQHSYAAVACTFTDAGDLVTKAGHGLVNGQTVNFKTIVTTTGISVDTLYYVVNKNTDDFQVALTAGGAPISLTTDGTGTVYLGGKICSLGYTTFKIRIYGATGNITAFAVKRHTVTTNVQYLPLLQACLGTTALTTLAYAFYDSTSPNAYCSSLLNITLPSALNSVTSMAQMCYYCYSLTSIAMPTSMSSASFTDMSLAFYYCYSLRSLILPYTLDYITTMANMCQYCSSLSTIKMPKALPALTTLSSTFSGCSSLTSCILPNNLSNLTTMASTFYNCYSIVNITMPGTVKSTFSSFDSTFYNCVCLESIQLPQMALNSLTTMNAMCQGCYSLQSVTLPTSATSLTTFSYTFIACYSLTGTITIPSTFSAIQSMVSAFTYCYSLQGISIASGITTITSLASTFYGCTNLLTLSLPTTLNSLTTMNAMCQGCYSLQSITLPTSMTSNANMVSAFQNCYSLTSLTLPSTMNAASLTMDSMCYLCYSLTSVTMPTSMTGITTLASAFRGCYSLLSLSLATTMNSLTTIASMCQDCYKLNSVTLFTSATALVTTTSAFLNCYALRAITLPNMTAVTVATSMFQNCYALESITNHANLGSTSSAVTATSMLVNTEQLTQSLSFAAKFDRFTLNGTSGKLLKTTSLRLTNTASTWAGGSPQLNVAYTSLATAAVETLFGDLPNNTAKTASMTGTLGVDSLISKASSGTTAGSTTITMANTSSLATGMEVYGTGVNGNWSCTFQDTGDTVTTVAHGLENGMKVAFATIVTTTGITVYTPYFVVNKTADTFQVSDTDGGSAKALTTNGSGTYITYPTIVTINTNVSIVLDRPCQASGTVTVTAGVLKRSIALLKGWTVTN